MAQMDAPVREGDRLDYLDILRGFAVLAIFAVNIKAMAAPFAFYSNASLWPGDYDQLVAQVQAFLIDDKWRTNFTALFGAGLVLIGMKAEASGVRGRGRILLRNSWLMIFGAIHLLLIWGGDILFAYALAGFLVLWFRNLSATIIGWVMLGLLLLSTVWVSGFGVMPALVPEVGAEVSGFLWGTNPDITAAELETYRGGVAGHLGDRWASAIMYIGLYYVMGGHLLQTIAIMLAGMWLFKIGFFRGAWSAGNYLMLAISALALSFGLEAMRQDYLARTDWSFEAYCFYTPVAEIAGYAGAFGYAALVGFFYRLGIRFPPVAAAGRMAFTNYIACSLSGTTVFYGHAGGLFGYLTLLQLMAIVAGVWLAILVWSPVWLRFLHFGPLEWLWRSLTYWKLQPLRRRAPTTPPPSAEPAAAQ